MPVILPRFLCFYGNLKKLRLVVFAIGPEFHDGPQGCNQEWPGLVAKQSLKQGEKVLFGIAIIFLIAAVIGYAILESVRHHAEKPLFASKTHFDMSADGLRGSEIFRSKRCTACHRALRNGTNMGLSLDGVGSKRSREWLERFLHDPENTYGAPTLDHGYPPKEAAYVSNLADEEIRLIAAFISELKAERGSSSAPEPPKGPSPFIDSMVGAFAPDSWRGRFQDIRDRDDDTDAVTEPNAAKRSEP